MLRKLTLTLLCTFTLISAGCGNEDNKDSDNNKNNDNDTGFDLDNTTPIPLDKFGEQSYKILIQLTCDGIFNCPEKQPMSFIRHTGRFADKADCVANLPKQFPFNGSSAFSSQSDGIEAGRLEYDPAQAAKCIAEYEKELKQCNPLNDATQSTLDGCQNVFTPKLQDGAPCGSAQECISKHCAYNNPNECFGRCADTTEPKKAGESCEWDDCADGLYCAPNLGDANNGNSCIKAKTRKKGEACNGLQILCEDNLTCTLNNVCDTRPPLAKKGEPCDNYNTICTPGLACIDAKEVSGNPLMVGTCGLPKTAGESCIMDNDCHVDLYCSGNLSNPGECTTPKPADASCTESSECEGSLWCKPNSDNTASICAPSENTAQACEIPAE